MMRTDEDALARSPTDLTTFVACHHAARLSLDLRLGRPTPERGRDPDAELLAELGGRHERAYLEHLRDQGLEVVVVGWESPHGAERVLELMSAGVDVVAQAPLEVGAWRGVADVLRRIERTSELGAHAYEVEDTKLSRTTRVGTVLQLLTYAAWLERLQGTPGEHVHVVAPGREAGTFHREALRVDDFAAVTRRVHRTFEAFVDDVVRGRADTKPEPVEHCQVCAWWAACRAHWRDVDHLTLVANLGGAHRAELDRLGVATRTALAAQHNHLSIRPEYGRREAYAAAAHQAAQQLQSEQSGRVVFEPLAPQPDEGLARLPRPSEHDVYLDLEGDPFFGTGGLEYLWGWRVRGGEVTQRWAVTAAEERRAFEAFIDFLVEHRGAHPEAHVFHFGGYEPGALKRLMGRHGTREEELDALLRAQAFVDLLGVVRQAFRIGVEAYTLKDLERLHGYAREADLRTIGPHKRQLEHALALGAAQEVEGRSWDAVATYNADDVRSTQALHEWLEARRIEQGIAARPAADGQMSEDLQVARSEATRVIEALRGRLPEDTETWAREHRALAVLADLVDFERRESKVGYWEMYALRAADAEELEASPKGLVGLRHLGRVGGTNKVPWHEYAYPEQDLDLRSRDGFYVRTDDGYRSLGIERLDPVRRRIVLRQGSGRGDLRPTEGYFWNIVDADVITDARLELARDVLARGIDAGGRFRAARDLLLKEVGRGIPGGARRRPEEPTLDAAIRLTLGLGGGVLPVQGPPGAGKTYTAARAVLALVRAGRSVGVTAISNAAITNLLIEVAEAAREGGMDVTVAQKVGRDQEVGAGVVPIREYADAVAGLRAGRVAVLGGTAWVWTRPELREAVDTLFIDEAGQCSLAMALSVASSARNVVLTGDPQQLSQPIKASHPEGADVTALDHLLEGHATLPEGRGLFLDRTYRMAPAITAFVSEAFYERRLGNDPPNERIALLAAGALTGSGISFVPVPHEGRDGVAPEEVDMVADLVGRLTATGVRFRDKRGAERPMRLGDVLVVAPFNRHVEALERSLPVGARVGTVDRFQGQEAPVVIYAMGVSSPELAPRGLDFLFDLHRFNVAISRAQACAVVVASPRLFDELPGSPKALRLLNAHVRMLEVAESAE